MTYLGTLDEFEDELEALYKTAPQAAELIDALIEELTGDEDCLRTLTDHVPRWLYLYSPAFEIKRFEHAWNDGRNIYLLKPYDENGRPLNYRFFIAHDAHTDEYFALCIQPRDTCYDPTTDAYRCLCTRYDGLGIRPAQRYS